MMTSANQLTVLRMAFVPVFILLIVYGHVDWAILVFFLAGITDMLDGLLARKFQQNTLLGTMLDPIADKLLLASAFVALSVERPGLEVTIPLWLTITVISRDVLLIVSVLIINLVAGTRIFPPTILGKATTLFQLVLVLMVLFSNFLTQPVPGLVFVLYSTLLLTVVSGLHYLVRGMGLLGPQQQSFDAQPTSTLRMGESGQSDVDRRLRAGGQKQP